MRINIIFPVETLDKPIISTAVKKYGVTINILRAQIDSAGGKVLAEIEGENIYDALDYIVSQGAIVKTIKEVVKVDKEKCIHCGACISVCVVNAITIDKKTREVKFDVEKCIGCGVCIKACPTKAISLSSQL